MSLEQDLRTYVISNQLPGENPDSVALDEDLLDSGILDSLAIMQLVTHIEKTYGITIKTEEIDPQYFETIQTLASFVRSKQGVSVVADSPTEDKQGIQTILQDVSKTSIWTLRCRAEEHLHPKGLFQDDKAIEWMSRVTWPQELDGWYSDYARMGVCIRTKALDTLVQKYLSRAPSSLVVELGCGLSSRYHRIATEQCQWLDFDRPDVIQARKELDPETSSHTYLSGDLMNFAWMDSLDGKQPDELIFLAEGLLMYFEREQVIDLIANMKQRFPGAVFIFDVQGHRARKINDPITQKVNAALKWAVKNKREVEQLPLRILSTRSLFSHYPERLGLSRFVYWYPPLRNLNLFVESYLD